MLDNHTALANNYYALINYVQEYITSWVKILWAIRIYVQYWDISLNNICIYLFNTGYFVIIIIIIIIIIMKRGR